MKRVHLTCDGCQWDMTDRSAALTLFDGKRRLDFCTHACFGRYVAKHYTVTVMA